MSRTLSDSEIAAILSEPKEIGPRQFPRLRKIAQRATKQRQGHADLRTQSRRQLRLRVSVIAHKNGNGFSVILSYVRRKKELILVRCNGHHGKHTNLLEKRARRGIAFIPPNTFHIHWLTERYQAFFGKDLGYAEPTSEFHSAESALEYVCNRFFIGEAKSGYAKYHPLLE